MNSFTRVVGLAGMTLWSFTAAAEVFSPGNQRNGLDDLGDTEVEHGIFSVGYANTLAYNNDSQPGILFTARYFAGEKWYLLGEAQLGQFSTRAVINDGQEVRSDDEECCVTPPARATRCFRGRPALAAFVRYPGCLRQN